MVDQKRRLAAIMFTDFVGYSSLSQKNEALALELIEEKRALIESHLTKFDGSLIKSTGDGFLLEFGSAIQAVNFANRLQIAMKERNSASDGDNIFFIRIGIHLGDVIYKDGDVFGDGVNIAARIEPLAQSGGISISQQVYDQVHNKINIGFRSLGTPDLKNIDAPIEVFEIFQLEDGKSPASSSSSKKRIKVPVPVWLTGAILLLVVAVWVFISNPTGSEELGNDENSQSPQTTETTESTQTEITPGIRSIAVLPFENLSDDAENEYFSDGMTEEILNSIAQMEGLRVISRTSVFQLKGKDMELAEIGEQLDVDHILEGSVRRSGEQVRINVRLVNIAEDRQIWSESYDRQIEDVFKVQDEIAAAIAEKLELQLGTSGAIASLVEPTENAAAYEYYLKGRFYLNKRTSEAFFQARNNFQEALGLDPEFAQAYSGLADTYNLMASYAYMEKSVAYPLAKEAAEKSLELDPTQAEATASLAYVKEFYDEEKDLEAAEALYQQAIEINTNYASAHQWYSSLLKFLDRDEEALQEAHLAHELDPLSPVITTWLANIYRLDEDYVQAEFFYEKALEIDPLFVNARVGLARLQQELRDFDAVEIQTEALAIERPNDMRVHLNWATGKMLNWKWDEAEEIYLNAIGLEEGPIWESNLRLSYALLLGLTGRTQEAVDQLEAAHSAAPENDAVLVMLTLFRGQLVYYHNYDHGFDVLESEFQKIIDDENEGPLNKASAHLFISYGLAIQEDFDGAIRALDTADQILIGQVDPNNPFEASLSRASLGQRGVVHALMGDRAMAQVYLDQLIEMEDQTGIPSYIAQIYLYLGELERTFQWIEVGVRNHDVTMATIAIDPNFEAIREDPRYEAFLAEMNLIEIAKNRQEP
jgi:TolB-like protein/class 3 adenylate cyclase